MVFNVFFDPEIIGTAAGAGDFGLEALCSALRGFLANCLLFDFEDQRGQTEIRQQLDAVPENFNRSIVKKLLAALRSGTASCSFWKQTIIRKKPTWIKR